MQNIGFIYKKGIFEVGILEQNNIGALKIVFFRMLCMSIIFAVVCLMWFTIRNFSGLPTIYEPMLWSLITKKKKNSKLKSFISNSPFQKGSKKGNNMASSSEEISYSLVRSNHCNLVQLKLLKKNGKSKYYVHLFFSQ